jgi:hypothetical protein
MGSALAPRIKVFQPKFRATGLLTLFFAWIYQGTVMYKIPLPQFFYGLTKSSSALGSAVS